jgi:DNA-binding IclR family transcriptional regulator
MSKTTKKTVSTQVLTRTSQLLRFLSGNRAEGLRLVDLCRLSGLERGTAHRLLKDMIAEGWVKQDPQTRTYTLGMAMFELGTRAPAMRLRELCRPHLLKLSEDIGETTVLTARAGNDGVCIDCVQGRELLGDRQMLGMRSPLIVGVPNMAILSGLPTQEFQSICIENLKRTDLEDIEESLKSLTSQVFQIQQRGYASQDEREFIGGAVIGLALYSGAGAVIASISVFAGAPLQSGASLAKLVAALKLTHTAVSLALQETYFQVSSI